MSHIVIIEFGCANNHRIYLVEGLVDSLMPIYVQQIRQSKELSYVSISLLQFNSDAFVEQEPPSLAEEEFCFQ